MFPFVIQMGEVEEFKLRQALQAMGLHDSAYWLSWHIYQSGMALLFGFFIRVFGIIFQLRIFHLTARQILFRLSAVVLTDSSGLSVSPLPSCSDFGVVFLTFWLFGQAMVRACAGDFCCFGRCSE